jgi:predicted nucleic acid-binding protein
MPKRYRARGADEYEELCNDRRLAYEYLPTDDEHWQAALNAQRELARTGGHRSVGVHDLVTAVLAAAHNLTVVHYDSDFETAATILAFEHGWVLPRGTL